ncbi:MAG: precorrin-4 C(11)-methyltransferase [Rhodospirillaceae bacterium]|nr:precorrin-4 C(11)-methyltransferase [Rhodospirillaceae bacterium]
MSVHFIGAGPGAPDLITVRGLKLIQMADVVLYAGSLVPVEVVSEAKPGARVVDTAPLHLDEIITEMKAAHDAGKTVARVHSGDPSIYGATAEQMRKLDELGIDYDVTPGVPAFAAAAAALGRELTLPDISQSIILTRTSVRASSMPEGETLEAFGKTGATLCVHLSVNNLKAVIDQLSPHYGNDCPVAVIYRASWPDQQIIQGTLETIRPKVKAAGITRTALIMVGRVLGDADFTNSKLYDAAHTHVLRPATGGEAT